MRSAPREVPGWQRWGLVVLGFILLHLTQRFSWPDTPAPLWFPSAGVGLVLIAWFGTRAIVLLWADLIAAVAIRMAMDADSLSTLEWHGCGVALLEGALQIGALWVGWRVYHSLLNGSRVLSDPRSMVLFLLLLPGLFMAGFAVLRVLLFAPRFDSLTAFTIEIASWWVAEALGVIALAPPLLCGVTPWLIRRGLLGAPEMQPRPTSVTPPVAPLRRPMPSYFGPPPLSVTEWVEIGILALCTGVLTLILLGWQHSPTPGGWQVWGVPLLVIVWASLRQGMRAATLSIAVATVLPLELLPGLNSPLAFQGNLMAHCAALLVAASVSWVRFSESRYRQVAAQIPVVLYSARLLPTPSSAAYSLRAEVTFVSPPSLGIMGSAAPELLGTYDQWLNRVAVEDREILLAAVMQLQRNSQPVTCEYRLAPLFAPAGERVPRRARWLRETLVPHLDHEGRLEGWDGMVLDISEQRALADDLRRTTNMFHTLIDNLPAGVFFVQAPRGQPILVNARARQLLGQRENASLDFHHFVDFYRLHRPDGTPYPVDELPVVVALQHGSSCMREDIVVHRVDGQRVPLVTWAAPITTGQSKSADAAVWVLEDLTALRQAEAARRESEVRLRGIIDALAEGVLVQDPDGVLLDCNAAAGKILGRPLESLVGKPLPDELQRFVLEDGTPLHEHPSRNVLKTRRGVRNLMLGYQRPTGTGGVEQRWILMNALPLLLVPNTPPAGVVVSLVDLTDLVRAQAQAQVRLSEESYRGLVDSLPLILLQLDAEFKVMAANPAMRELTGLSESELRQRSIDEVFVPAGDSGSADLYQQARAGRAARGECRFRSHGGGERVGYLLLQPQLDATDPSQLAGATLLVVDMTRERRLARELQRSQRLELVGRLSSGIAHDFNNLLTAILGLGHLVQAALGPDHAAAEDVARILEVGEQASNLAQQLLDFSKQRKVPLRAVEITRVIRRTVDVLRTLMPSNIRLECSLPRSEVILHADEMQLQQVLMNLCLNSRDAMQDGGRLHVWAERIGEPASEWLRLSVHDSGTGMTDAVRTHIFDPFFTTKELGSGLGLAVVKQIVDSFGGHIRVASELGLGSRFEVWLPLRLNPGDAI